MLLASSRASGSRPTSRSSTASSPGSATTRAARSLDATGRWVVPGFIDAHMHLESSKLLVDEFARLVLPFGTTAVVADPHEIANVLGTDGVHWLLDVCGRPSARRLLHGLVVRARLALRVAAPRAHAGRPRRAAAPPARDRARRDDELPRRHRRRRQPSSRSSRSRGTSTATRPACSAATLNAYAAAGIRSDHEAYDGRGGPRAAARRHVAADPRGLGGAQPAGPAAAARRVRAGPDRLLHRRPRAGAHRRRRAHQLDGARRGRVRDPAGGRARLRDAQPGALARPRTPRRGRARLPGRPPGPARPRALRARRSC